jgi:hypothetical protein
MTVMSASRRASPSASFDTFRCVLEDAFAQNQPSGDAEWPFVWAIQAEGESPTEVTLGDRVALECDALTKVVAIQLAVAATVERARFMGVGFSERDPLTGSPVGLQVLAIERGEGSHISRASLGRVALERRGGHLVPGAWNWEEADLHVTLQDFWGKVIHVACMGVPVLDMLLAQGGRSASALHRTLFGWVAASLNVNPVVEYAHLEACAENPRHAPLADPLVRLN